MADQYLNHVSGLSALLSQLGGTLDAGAQNNAQLRGLVASHVLPADAAPADGIFGRLLNTFVPSTVKPLQAGPAATGVPGLPGPAQAPAPVGPAPAMSYAPTGSVPQPQAPAAPRQPGPLPSMAAMQGAPQGMGLNGLFNGVEQKFGLPAGYLAQTAQIESGGNPNAFNKGSGAGGLFQFVPGTAKQYGLTDPTNPVASTFAAGQLAANNAQMLAKTLGRAPTGPELYLAHQQGAGGASALLSNPNARAGDLVGDAAVRSNGGDPNMTAGQFANLWMSKFGSGAGGAGMPQQAAAGGLGVGGVGGSPAPLRGPSPYGALEPVGAPAGSLPSMVTSGMAGLSPATSLPRGVVPPGGSMGRSASGQPVPIDPNGNALGYTPPGAVAPAARAIAAAAPVSDPSDLPVTIPGFKGTWTRAAAEATEADDSPEVAQVAAAQKSSQQAPVAAGGAVPPAPALNTPTAPGTANAGSINAPLQQAPNPAAAAPTQSAVPTLDQVKQLIYNPATRQMGLQYLQAMQQPKAPISVAQGTTLVNPTTLQPLYTNPKDDAVTDTGEVKNYKFYSDQAKAAGQQPVPFEAWLGSHSSGRGAQAHVVRQNETLVDNSGKPLYTNNSGGSTTDPNLIETLARRVYAGDTTALIGLSRGAAGSALIGAVQKRAGELAQQYKGQPLPDFAESDILANRADQIGNQAGARASGTLNARLDTYAKEASGAMDLGLQASRQVPRTTWTPLNRAMQAVQNGSGDPQLAAFVAANNAIINTYAKAINPNGVPTVSDKVHASEVLSTAQSPEAYEATVRQLQREINIAHNAARGARAAERSGEAAKDMAVTQDTGAPGSQSVSVGAMVAGAGRSQNTAPPIGTIVKGYRFNGGDPSQPSSWTPNQ